MKKIIIGALIILSTTPAIAGRESGGGIAIVCRGQSGKITSAKLLDYYEAAGRGINIDLGPPYLSVQQKLDLALSRLALVDPIRAEHYRERLKAFYDPKNFLKNSVLPDTNDAYERSWPENCKPEQLAIRQKPRFPEDTLWRVNQDIYDALDDNDQRAGLGLHEVIYEELGTQEFLPQADSINARYFNSYISSGKTLTMDRPRYFSFVQGLDFNWATGSFTIAGVSQNVGISFYLYRGPSTHGFQQIEDWGPGGPSEGILVPAPDKDYFEQPLFFSNTLPQAVTVNEATIQFQGKTLDVGSSGMTYDGTGDAWPTIFVDAYPSGAIKSFRLNDRDGYWQTIHINGQDLAASEVTLYETGEIWRVVFAEDVVLTDAAGKKYPLNGVIGYFDKKGNYDPSLANIIDPWNQL